MVLISGDGSVVLCGGELLWCGGGLWCGVVCDVVWW